MKATRDGRQTATATIAAHRARVDDDGEDLEARARGVGTRDGDRGDDRGGADAEEGGEGEATEKASGRDDGDDGRGGVDGRDDDENDDDDEIKIDRVARRRRGRDEDEEVKDEIQIISGG